MSSRTALVVEDNPSVRKLCALLLERAGCAVLQAASATDAAHLSRNFAAPIDLLICDVVLPDSDGRQLARELLEARPDLKILMLSGYPEHIVAAANEERPSGEFLAKPFSSVDFLNCVRDLLAQVPDRSQASKIAEAGPEP